MTSRARHIGCTLLIGFLLFFAHPGHAQKPTLKNITFSGVDSELLLYLTVDKAFSEKIKRQILEGGSTAFAFVIRLSAVRELRFDIKLADLSLTHTIRYDTLKKEFTVRRSWKGNEAETTTSFDEAQQWMSQVEDLKIIPLNRLEKGASYQLRAKAEMSPRKLPLNLHSFLFFVSFWEEETDWYIIDFTY